MYLAQTVRNGCFVCFILWGFFVRDWRPTYNQCWLIVAVLLWFLIEQQLIRLIDLNNTIRAWRCQPEIWPGHPNRRFTEFCNIDHGPCPMCGAGGKMYPRHLHDLPTVTADFYPKNKQ